MPSLSSHDLLEALRLPFFYLRHAEEFSWREPLYDIPEATRAKYQGRVIVAGSCNSQRLVSKRLGLGNLLASSLHRLYLDRSLPNGTETEPLVSLSTRELVLEKGDLLVWEFPARQFPGDHWKLPPLATESR